MHDPSSEVTVFVTTIGDEENFRDCLSHLDRQSARFRLEIIRNVAPLSAALQQMIDRCTTPYYVQVDEDMLLFPDAVRRLHAAIVDAPARVALVCAPLWDCDVEQPIYGVKIYRRAVVAGFPYQNTFSCEKAQLCRMRDAGFDLLLLPAGGRSDCFGEHGKHYTPATIFARWQRLFHKQRRYGTLDWIEPWPARLLQRYLETRDPLHLYALLGAVSGISGELPPDRETDFREPCVQYERLAAYFK
jgi:hypothetical protein